MKQITEVDGVAVIEQTQAYGAHPNPNQNGKLVPFNDVVHLLMADGRDLFICTRDDSCDYVADSVQSVVSHMSKHNPDRCKPTTPEPVLRDVIRTVRTVLRYGDGRNAYAAAAADLNRRGIKPTHSAEWTDSAVRALYRRYADEFPRVGPRSRPRVSSSAAPTAVTGTAPDLELLNLVELGDSVELAEPIVYDREKVMTLLDEFDRELEQARTTGREIRNLLVHMPDAPVVDPAIVEKAAQFDAMRQMLRP